MSRPQPVQGAAEVRPGYIWAGHAGHCPRRRHDERRGRKGKNQISSFFLLHFVIYNDESILQTNKKRDKTLVLRIHIYYLFFTSKVQVDSNKENGKCILFYFLPT